jgi:predicted permease
MILRILRKLWYRILAIFRISRFENEMEREMQFHLDMETEKNLRRGMTPKEARRVALIHFGGVEQTKEDCRETSRAMFLENLWRDVSYGARILIKNPGFTIIAVITLALGIGANTAIFSVIYGVLLRPLPYKNGEQLVVLHQEAPLAGISAGGFGFSVKEIIDYREQSQTLESVVEHHSMSFTLFGGAEPENIQTGVVSANFFDVMGVRPLLGRTFVPEDEAPGAEAVLVLSYDYWKRSHDGDPNIVGRVFRMNNRPHTVVGVLPSIPQYPRENDVYMPTTACPTRASEGFITNRNRRMMGAFGRLKPGISVEQAKSEIAAIAAGMQREHPDSYPDNIGFRATLDPLQEELTRQARPTFLILLGTAGLVLLLACANVANLTLSRLMRREREMAVRSALGASQSRLIRQLLTESTLVALAGGVLGIILAAAGLNLLVEFASRYTSRASEISLDGSVLFFTLAISIISGIGFGLIPALSTRENLVTALKEGSGQSTISNARQRIRAALLVAQVTISFILLIGAGLMLRSLNNLQHVNPGFNPERVLVMPLSANWSKYTTPDQYRDFSLRVVDKIKDQPGVMSTAVGTTYPLNPLGIAFGPFNIKFKIEGRPVPEGELAPQTDYRRVSADYFQTIGVPLIRGRLFAESDKKGTQEVAILNQSMAAHRWGDEDPIGRRVYLDNGDGTETLVTIVGIVGNVKQYGLEREPGDELYRPVAQGGGATNLLVRTTNDPELLTRQIRKAIYEVDPETAINKVTTLEDVRNESLSSPKLITILLGMFAALSLVITATGIAGVIALMVNQRTHEIGIRLALGASPARVLAMVLRQGMTLVFLGLALGVAGAVGLSHVLSALLFGVQPTDLITFLGVSLSLILASGAACLVPARRVTSIDPMRALRSE